jgi:predicted MFS family arabinose efflux permease
MSRSSSVRPIVLLSAAAFASVATMRVADPLIPQIAQEFRISVGDASVIATAFALSYGLCQLIYGVLGDRFGKYRLVVLAVLATAPMVASAGLASSLAGLGFARLASGATAGAIVPLAMAFVGDHVPYEHRQPALARFLTGTLLGMVAGQIFGGVLGDLVGWRGVFFLLGGLFLAIGGLLLAELRSGRVPPPILSAKISPAAVIEAYRLLLGRRWARIVLATVFVEGFLFYGAFTFIGAYLHLEFELDFAIVGIFLATTALGGLAYTLCVRRLVAALGERGLALTGGTVIALAFGLLAVGGLAVIAPAIVLLGLGIQMLHNTLQTNATQMAPSARGLAVTTFANALFLGQAAGVWLCGVVVDRVGFVPVFVVAGAALALLGAVFSHSIARRPSPQLEAQEVSR